jgi:TrmH family RNA methyltransferase
MKDVFERTSVAVVDLKYPMNIGSVARTMSCSGYKSLNLVRPCPDWCNLDAIKYSLFGEPVLSSAEVFSSLEELKNKDTVLFGFSRRIGKNRSHPLLLTELGESIIKFHINKKIVLVFGGESSGLSTEDLSICDHIVTIDTDLVCNSLSLPCAAAMVLYEFKRSLVRLKPLEQKRLKLDEGQAGMLSDRVRELLNKQGFIDNRDRKRVMPKLNSIIKRLSTSEVRLLHSIFKKR